MITIIMQTLSTMASQFVFVTGFIGSGVALDDQITGDRPNVTGRLELGLQLLFCVFGMIDPLFPLTAAIRAVLLAPVAALFVLEGIVRYRGFSKESFSKLAYPIALFVTIVFYPTVTALAWVSLGRLLLMLSGVYVPANDFFNEKPSNTWYARGVHFIVVRLTSILKISLALVFAFAVYSQLAIGLPVMLTAAFLVIYALRDFRLLDPSTNLNLFNLNNYASTYIFMSSFLGRVLLLVFNGGYRLAKPIMMILGYHSKIEREYAYSKVSVDRQQSLKDSLLNMGDIRLSYLCKDFHITRDLLCGSEYDFNARCQEHPLTIMERVKLQLAAKLNDDYQLKVEVTVPVEGDEAADKEESIYSKSDVLKHLEVVVNKIMFREGTFAAFRDFESLSNILGHGLVALEKALEENKFDEADTILRALLEDENTCPGGLYSGYKTAFAQYAGNAAFLIDLENEKDLNLKQAYNRVLNISPVGIVTPNDGEQRTIFHDMMPAMNQVLNAHSKHDNNEVHKYNDFVGIFAGGHYTLSHAAAAQDAASLASQNFVLLGWTSYFAVGEYEANDIDRYVKAIGDESRLALWQEKMGELSQMSIDDLKNLYDTLKPYADKDSCEIWQDILRMESNDDLDIETHLGLFWYDLLSTRVLLAELERIGYIAKHKNITNPTIYTYLLDIWEAIKIVAIQFIHGCLHALKDVSYLSFDILKSPIRAADFTIQRAAKMAGFSKTSSKTEKEDTLIFKPQAV